MDHDSTKKRRIDEAGDDSSVSDTRKLIAGMSRESALDFIAEIAARNQSVYDELQNLLNEDPELRKLFIRSIDWNTTDETLRKVFGEFGEIEDCNVVKDLATGRSKGFGFITYTSIDGAQRALVAGPQTIDDRQVHIHLASEKNDRPKPHQFAPSHSQMQQTVWNPAFVQSGGTTTSETKLFVHGLSWDTTSESLRKSFEVYGPLQEAVITFDKETGKSRGFGFVTFLHTHSAQAACLEPNKIIDGRATKCNFASERKKENGGKMAPAGQGPFVQPSAGVVNPFVFAQTQPLMGTVQPQLVDIQSQLQNLQAAQLQLAQRFASAPTQSNPGYSQNIPANRGAGTGGSGGGAPTDNRQYW